MNIPSKELKLIRRGLDLYKAKLKKAMKQTEEVGAGEKDVKSVFLETEALISRIDSEKE